MMKVVMRIDLLLEANAYQTKAMVVAMAMVVVVMVMVKIVIVVMGIWRR